MLEYIHVLREHCKIYVIVPHEGEFQCSLISKNIEYKIIRQYNWSYNLEKFSYCRKLKLLIRNTLAFLFYILFFIRIRPNYVFTNTILSHIGARASKYLCIPHIWWIHEYGDKDFNIKINWGNVYKGYRYIDLMSYKIICNSLDVSQFYSKYISSTKINTIYQPVTIENLHSNVVKKKFTFLMFGQISDSKNISLVLDSFGSTFKKSLNQLYIDIYGPCEDQQYLQSIYSQIKELGIEQVVKLYVGFFRPSQIIPQYYYIINASKSEAFGRVVVEAQKYGVCPIVRNHAGVKELVSIHNGILFDTFDDLSRIMLNIEWTSNYSNQPSYDEKLEIEKLYELIQIEKK